MRSPFPAGELLDPQPHLIHPFNKKHAVFGEDVELSLMNFGMMNKGFAMRWANTKSNLHKLTGGEEGRGGMAWRPIYGSLPRRLGENKAECGIRGQVQGRAVFLPSLRGAFTVKLQQSALVQQQTRKQCRSLELWMYMSILKKKQKNTPHVNTWLFFCVFFFS